VPGDRHADGQQIGRSRSPRATKTPFDIIKKVEQKTGATAPPAPAKLTPADKDDVEQLIA
jgi:hypothetical protein